MVERPDSRTDNTQLRAFSASQNILNRADGSAKFEFGATSVITSVNGPIDVSLRDEKLDEATIEVVVRPPKGVSTTKEKLMENTLRTAFAPIILAGMMPRTLIQIVVQILKDDGSVLAAAANSIALALLDAGVPMRQMVGSVTCMIDEKTMDLILDPTTIELENAKSVHTFAFDNGKTSKNALLSDSEGVFSEEEYFSSCDLCYEAVHKVHGFLRTAVESKKEKEMN
ncbi:ribosomal protein S5 domain 2-like protein [Backusella circina FSU 941]|nr:ribosomal protein S5 domain 2-like protein [Backusella circina FSU 941]